MRNTGRHSEKSGYLVILLLVVALTAFSHSMKELTDLHRLTLDASRVVAQWSGNVTPAAIPQIPQAPQIAAVKIERVESSCQNKQSAPSVELPELTEPSAAAPAVPRQTRASKIKKLPRSDVDADAFEVRIPAVQLPDSDERATTEFPAFTFKTKTRKPSAIRINPPDREILLKTLNRSISLRIAS